MEAILHILGACGDNHSHLDLIDILFGGTFIGGAVAYIKYYWYGIKLIIKDFFKNNNHEQ